MSAAFDHVGPRIHKRIFADPRFGHSRTGYWLNVFSVATEYWSNERRHCGRPGIKIHVVGLKQNLFEFLGEPVMDVDPISGTEITLTGTDEYDVPDDGPDSSSSAADIWNQTIDTRQDNDTYDNDVNLGLDVPGIDVQTERTSFTGDTYDNDVDLFMMGTPVFCFDQTNITKVEGETTDDDNSVESLSFPSA